MYDYDDEREVQVDFSTIESKLDDLEQELASATSLLRDIQRAAGSIAGWVNILGLIAAIYGLVQIVGDLKKYGFI